MKRLKVAPTPREPESDAPRHQERVSDGKPVLERLAEFALPLLDREVTYAKQAVDEHRRGAKRHLPEAYRRLCARQVSLQQLHDEVKVLVTPNANPGLPDPAQISLVAQAVTAGIQRCGLENLASLVRANMPKYLQVAPRDVGLVLKSVSTLEDVWTRQRKG